MVTFRKSKKIGPLRITASKKGLSLSGGVPGARITSNTKGEVRRTVGVPGTGVYDTKKLGSGQKSAQPQQAAAPERKVQVTTVDATGGTRALLSKQKDVAYLQVVSAKDIPGAAIHAGINRNAQGWARGIRDALLMPNGTEYRVVLLVQPADNPAAFGRKDTTTQGMDLGRIGKRDLDKWSEAFAGRTIAAVVYIEATPNRTPYAEVRFKPTLLEQSQQAVAAADIAPGWYSDPEGEATYRYWDGIAWTGHVSDGG